MSTSTVYSLDFLNQTSDTWTLCVYQELPDSPGLDSVAWKQTTVPQQGESGLQWNVQYMAAIAQYQQIGGKGVYKASQKIGTKLGKKWVCKFESDVQQLFEDGGTTAGHLLIQNQSGALANPAIAVDGDIALVKSDVYSGNSAQFVVKPKYFVALFANLTQGEVISGNQIHGPLPVVFEGAQTTKRYVAEVKGATFIFKEEGNDANIFEAPYAQVLDRIRSVHGA